MFSYHNREGNTEEIDKLVSPLKKYDKVLMLYFPRRAKNATPTPDGSVSEADYDDDYTPFLIKMKPKEYKVTLYYKKPLREVTEESSLYLKRKLPLSYF